MGIRDVGARNRSLDNDYGATKGPNAASAHQVALFVGDPMSGGVELENMTDSDLGLVPNGYARVVLPNDGTSWLAAAYGAKTTAAPVQFPDALVEYPDSVTHWALIDDADGSTMWDCGELVEPYEQAAAGTGPNPLISVFYDDSVEGLL